MFGTPLSARLERSSRILVAGAGGGLDVYAGLPLALSLREAGKEVHLANLSFSHLDALDLDVWLFEDVAEIRPDTTTRDWYFPEGCLARWLATHGQPSTVYAFPKVGVRPLLPQGGRPPAASPRWASARCAPRTPSSPSTSTWTRSSWWTAAPTSSCAATKPASAPRPRT
ncbi:hypothetical protein AB0H88_26305 [Nonomuraea sp. NPDC050680]|uniref:hypothetical protein n=1 Tax=Nonomuraea sp. NPDC050680 TaxID=3154630 RepID=UPI003402B1C7